MGERRRAAAIAVLVNGFDGDALIDDLASAAGPADRFGALTAHLSRLGLGIVNYGFFDARAAELVNADIQFLTTMTDDWMRYYYEQGLAASDIHVNRVQARKITPYRWGQQLIDGLAPGREKVTALEGAEAGLRSSLCVPLASPLDPFTPIAGINLGSSMGESEFAQVLREHGATLLSIAYLFHNASIRQLWSERSKGRSLSVRERDCLQFLADGKRQERIAHIMGIARVTVELHLRSARQKLHARTLNEAIAKALVAGEIRRA